MASVFSMEEHVISRDSNVSPDDVMVEIKDGAYSWGFRVKENQEKTDGN